MNVALAGPLISPAWKPAFASPKDMAEAMMATEGASVMVSVAKRQQDPSLAVLVRGSLIVDPLAPPASPDRKSVV